MKKIIIPLILILSLSGCKDYIEINDLAILTGIVIDYKDNMYASMIDDREFAIKPMNCPGGILVYKNSLHSYKELPIRLGELGQVHRHEASGALNGLFRVRTFTQDDAHIFCTMDQLESEVVNLIAFIDRIYKIFNLKYTIELSTRPETGYIGDLETWNRSEDALKKACLASGHDFKINEGDGAFYGPKLDFHLIDSLGREWQCGTVQLDMNLPERFECTYIAEDGTKKTPVMLHRVVFGSIERFIGILIEHFAGNFPLWLASKQVVIIPVHHENHLAYANKVKEALANINVRVSIDDRNEKLGYRIREAQIHKIPVEVVVGDNDRDNNQVTVRRFGKKEEVKLSLDEFVNSIKLEIESKELPH